MPNITSHIDDQAVWVQLMQGNELALARLYDMYVDVLYNYGRRITPRSEIIEDAIQDLLTEIWYRRERLSVPDSVKAYLLRAFRRTLLKQLYQYKRLTFTGEYLPMGEEDDHQYLHTQILSEIEAEFKTDLQQAMVALSQKEQEAIALRYTENLSHDEIASIMGIKKQTLYNLLHQAIQKLTKSLKNKYPADGVFTPFAITLLLLSGGLDFSV
ncbi:MAG: sigma-70 family RNA polymerase sigma factor [Cyclobacteriaceae bacterium]